MIVVLLACIASGLSASAAGSAPSSPAPPTAASLPADTSGHPVFTGRWKLALDRSVLGKLPGIPKARADSIEQRPNQIVQTLYLVLGTGPDTTVYRYRLGGEPTVNRVGTQDITSNVAWEGDTLHLLSKTKLMMLEMTLDERWKLSPKRDSLVMTRAVKYPMGEGWQRLVFVRQ